MVITDMRMESEAAGAEVVHAARVAPYHPAVALLTAFPVDEGDWDSGVAPDKVLVKATQTRVLLGQLEKMLAVRAEKLQRLASKANMPAAGAQAALPADDVSLAAAADATTPARPAKRTRAPKAKVGA